MPNSAEAIIFINNVLHAESELADADDCLQQAVERREAAFQTVRLTHTELSGQIGVSEDWDVEKFIQSDCGRVLRVSRSGVTLIEVESC